MAEQPVDLEALAADVLEQLAAASERRRGERKAATEPDPAPRSAPLPAGPQEPDGARGEVRAGPGAQFQLRRRK